MLQGQHVQTGEQLRRPGALKREARDEHGQALLDDDGRPVLERVTGVAHVEMTMSVPKSVSVLWAMADEHDRQTIEQALLEAAERTVQYMAQNKAVVHRRGKDGVRVREPAAGAAVASSLHVTARRARGDRAPAPQLHVHNLVVGVVRTDGRLVAADSWEWFRHDAALEGGALFRAQVADALVKAGWAIRSGTGDRGRYFEVEGVPEALCEVMSPRSREVAEARAEIERELGVRLQGGALAVLAKETRQAKDHDLDPERLRQVWDALGQEHDFGPGAGSRLRRRERPGRARSRRGCARRGEVVLAQLREQGPTVSVARARALVFEAAAGRLSADEAARLLARMECSKGGELLALEGGRVTSREIRQLEQHVMDVAVRAAGRRTRWRRSAGLSGTPGFGRRRPRSARASTWTASSCEAFELLTGGPGWVCLTGRAGTGKGPVAARGRGGLPGGGVAGDRVRDGRHHRPADGRAARRHRAGADRRAAQGPPRRAGAIEIDERTVIFVDEASKLDTGHWAELAKAVERHGASVRAVGHDGQHDAIRLPGLFSEMLLRPADPHGGAAADPPAPRPRQPRARRIRGCASTRSRSIDGRGLDAVAILQEHQRAQALRHPRASDGRDGRGVGPRGGAATSQPSRR